MIDSWDTIEDRLRTQQEPSEDDVDFLVGNAAQVKVQEVLCRLLSSDNTELCYELCHALLDFEIPITDKIAAAVRPMLTQKSRRIFMAALHVTIMQSDQKGLREWAALRKDVSAEWRGIGDDLVKYITR